MKSSKRLWLLLAIVGAAAVFVVFCFRSKPQTQQLPDGSSLILEKVSFGKKHMFVYDKSYRRLLWPLLHLEKNQPLTVFGYYLPMPSSTVIRTKTNTIVFFLSREATNFPADDLFWSNNVRAVVFDEHGNERPATDSGSSASARAEYWTDAEFRGNTIGLQILLKTTETNWIKAAEFRIKNPVSKAQSR